MTFMSKELLENVRDRRLASENFSVSLGTSPYYVFDAGPGGSFLSCSMESEDLIFLGNLFSNFLSMGSQVGIANSFVTPWRAWTNSPKSYDFSSHKSGTLLFDFFMEEKRIGYTVDGERVDLDFHQAEMKTASGPMTKEIWTCDLFRMEVHLGLFSSKHASIEFLSRNPEFIFSGRFSHCTHVIKPVVNYLIRKSEEKND